MRNVVCSPGSRNAALLQEADRCDALGKHVVIDERAAAFIALGLGMVSRRPVALVCTSGTALLNYAPAVAEAYYQGIPLIVISADRPAEWIDQDDSQTIRQPGALSNIVKQTFDIDACCTSQDYEWFANRMLNEGLQKALAPKAGPVHFNVHLDGTMPEEGEEREVRKIETEMPAQVLPPPVIKRLATEATDKKVMVVAGFMPADNKMQKAFSLLASLPNVCIMAETVSNLHLPEECFAVDTVLFPLEEKEKERLRPDILISVGGALISRKLKEYLRKYQPTQHWAVGHSDNVIDCFKALTCKLECDPASFMQTFGRLTASIRKKSGIDSNYRDSWKKVRTARNLQGEIMELPWCDLKALAILLKALPVKANLFLSNGTAVRYGQIIPYRVSHATYSNRGVSGIEGSTSTALGGALAYDGISCLVSGDMSFMYDLGAFSSGLKPENLRVVVLDNGGGDIFRFIGATKDLEIRERYLSADPKTPVAAIAQAFNYKYYRASNEKDLRRVLPEFFRTSKVPSILHLDTRETQFNSTYLTKFLNKK